MNWYLIGGIVVVLIVLLVIRQKQKG